MRSIDEMLDLWMPHFANCNVVTNPQKPPFWTVCTCGMGWRRDGMLQDVEALLKKRMSEQWEMGFDAHANGRKSK